MIAKAARGLEGFSFEQFLGLFVEVGGLLPNGQVFESFVRHNRFVVLGLLVVTKVAGSVEFQIGNFKFEITAKPAAGPDCRRW